MAALAIACLLMALNASALFAQTGRANLSGTVADTQGAVVPDATVTAVNVKTGIATPATSNGAGVYNILQVIPGVYDVQVEKAEV